MINIPRQWCIQWVVIIFLMCQCDSWLIWDTGGFQLICEHCRIISKIQHFYPSPIKVRRKTPNNFTGSLIGFEPKILQDQGGICSSILCFKLDACYAVTWENRLHSWFWENASTFIGIHMWKVFKGIHTSSYNFCAKQRIWNSNFKKPIAFY